MDGGGRAAQEQQPNAWFAVPGMAPEVNKRGFAATLFVPLWGLGGKKASDQPNLPAVKAARWFAVTDEVTRSPPTTGRPQPWRAGAFGRGGAPKARRGRLARRVQLRGVGAGAGLARFFARRVTDIRAP